MILNTIALMHRIRDGAIETGQPTLMVAWGEDEQSLFLTGDSSIYRLRLTTGAYQY